MKWQFTTMGRKFLLGALVLLAPHAPAAAVAPLRDPERLNIGINCQWQSDCERRQLHAKDEARRYIARARPPVWRIHLCNRNARRAVARIDWTGFNHCIRNNKLKPLRRR